MQLSGTWNYPTSVRFGAGRIAELSAAVRETGITRPMFVTDPNLAGLPMTRNAIGQLTGVGASLFSDIRPNPVEANISDGVAAFRDGGHDGVVAFGGGSALDVGKLIAFAAGQTRPIWDFEDVGDNWRRADPARIAPVVAVPTTAGTGSEVGRAGVVVDEKTRNIQAQATLANPSGLLRAGMFVQVEAVLPESSHVIALPASAINHAPYGDSVYVVEEMKGPDGSTYRGARQHFVKLGPARGDLVAVISGVEPGQEVVTSGVFKLRNGSAVQVNNDVVPGDNPAPRPQDS